MSTAVTPLPLSTLVPAINAYGAMLICSWVAIGLYGLTTTQAYLYLDRYTNDSQWTRSLVILLFVLNTAHAVVVCHSCYYHVIVALLEPSVLLRNVWSLNLTILFYVMVATIVMSYYIKIIFQLSGKRRFRWWLTGAIAIPVVLFFTFKLDACVRMFLISNGEDEIGFVHSTTFPALVFQTVSDALIAASMCVLLYTKHTYFKRTRDLIKALMFYAVGRGLVTLLTTLAMILAIAISPDNFWYVGIEFTLVGLYTNALMMVLNARRPSCEIMEDCPLDSASHKLHCILPVRMGQAAIYPGNKHRNVEFISLGAKEATVKDNEQVKPNQ